MRTRAYHYEALDFMDAQQKSRLSSPQEHNMQKPTLKKEEKIVSVDLLFSCLCVNHFISKGNETLDHFVSFLGFEDSDSSRRAFFCSFMCINRLGVSCILTV